MTEATNCIIAGQAYPPDFSEYYGDPQLRAADPQGVLGYLLTPKLGLFHLDDGRALIVDARRLRGLPLRAQVHGSAITCSGYAELKAACDEY